MGKGRVKNVLTLTSASLIPPEMSDPKAFGRCLYSLGNMLPAMIISDIPAMIHKPQIASVVVQLVAIDMITLFAFLQMPAQNAF